MFLGRALQISRSYLTEQQVYGPILAPTGLHASGPTDTTINLVWVDNSTNETVFKIERSLDNVIFTQVNTVSANTINYTDTDLTPGTLYYYRVKASHGGGDSAYSNVSSSTTTGGAGNIAFTSGFSNGFN